MTAVLRSPSHLPSSPSSSLSVVATADGPHQTMSLSSDDPSTSMETERGEEEKSVEKNASGRKEEDEDEEEDQLSLLTLLVAVLRKSIVACNTDREKDFMEIGWPTNVRHVAHVTFDRFHGFLGLPVEFEPEVPRRAPSASTNVFGVSTDSMQCSFDLRGNSVPTILLLMQRRLYSQGGLQAEGIFRINAENSQEEHVRDQLNSGIVPEGIDVHCLAGLIKAWFRELPSGVLDALTPEQVMQCHTEEECVALVKLLPPTDAALLDWAINLMADVVQEEHHNKMNARNVAMVFAPNMTQMDDPLTALMYAVQVMNFLKTLIERALKERQDSVLKALSASHSNPPDENGHHSPSRLGLESHSVVEPEKTFVTEDPILENAFPPVDNAFADDGMENSCLANDTISGPMCHSTNGQSLEVPTRAGDLMTRSLSVANAPKPGGHVKCRKKKGAQSSNPKHRKGLKKVNGQPALLATTPAEKSKGTSIVSRINSRAERVEAWR